MALRRGLHQDQWRAPKRRSSLLLPGIRFTTIHPGFVATERISEDGLPKLFQISQEQAAWHVVRALEKEPAQA
jgi:NAD(P)-dependent dehydrogenase (short-subunit alcohol dehydrogenase family)